MGSHIEVVLNRVVGAVSLTGKQYNAKLAPPYASRRNHQSAEQDHSPLEHEFQDATGYGFDGLTESEAHYLAKYEPA